MKGPGCVSCVNPLMGKTRVDHGGTGTSKSDQRMEQIDGINLCCDQDSVLDRSNAHNLI